jgi:hypothetical protein
VKPDLAVPVAAAGWVAAGLWRCCGGGEAGEGLAAPVPCLGGKLPRVFRTGNHVTIYAAACISSSSSMTSCGVLALQGLALQAPAVPTFRAGPGP